MRPGSRLVIGAGGTGRSHLLRRWLDESGIDGAVDDVAHLAGSPLRAVTLADAAGAVEPGPTLVLADDIQWFEPEALELLIATSETTPVLASRRPAVGDEPTIEALELLTETLTRDRPAERLGLWDIDSFATGLAALRAGAGGEAGRAISSELVEALHLATEGSVGLAADCVSTGWEGTGEHLPAELVDAVVTRIRRAGPAAADLTAAWAVMSEYDDQTPLRRALRVLGADVDPDQAERALRAGGLLGSDSRLIPLVRRAALADLAAGRRAELNDRAAVTLARSNPIAAAEHVLAGAGTLRDGPQILASAALALSTSDPGQAAGYIDGASELGLGATDVALLRALVAFHQGAPEVLAHLDQAAEASEGPLGTRAALLGYGADLRELRFDDAAGRPIDGDLAEPLAALAATLSGRPVRPATKTDRTPLGQVVATVANALNSLATGAIPDAIGGFSAAADDFDRLQTSAPLGFTPHGLGAMAALAVGDLSAAEILTDQAIDRDSGGPGERLGHRLLRAHGRLVTGDYSEALDLLREHTTAEPAAQAERGEPAEATESGDPSGASLATSARLAQRDRLLLAALEAAVARRSGDTGRLRAAWRRSEAALLRPSSSWLLVDFFVELLSAGARLEDNRRVGSVLAGLVEQTTAMPAAGHCPTAGSWLALQVAVSGDDGDAVTEAASAMAAVRAADPIVAQDERSLARAAAADVWARVIAREATEAEVVEVAERLVAIGDGWEASRLLGRAALDEDDPKAARRMLELARVSGNERVDEASGDGLAALGLSEREAEVALLVAEGRTHKEVGAQLFISPKTVEHHVAKIRQKLGAGSRAELLSIVREAAGQA